MAVVFEIEVNDQGTPKIRQFADAHGKLGKEQKNTTSAGMKFAAAVTTINQGLEVAKKLYGAVNKALGTFKKYTIDIAKEQARLADDLAKTARGLNMQAQELQAIRSAWQMAGVEVSQTDRAMLNVQKSILDASRGLSTQTELFQMAGVEIRKSNGELKTGTEVTREIAANIKNGLVPAQTQAALSAQLFRDRTGMVLNALKAGDEAIDEATERLERYGALMSGELLAASEAYVDSTQRLKEAQTGLKNSIAEGTLPTLTALNNALAEFIGQQKLARDGLSSGLGEVFPQMVYWGIRAGEAFVQLGLKLDRVGIRMSMLGATIRGDFVRAIRDILVATKKVAVALGVDGMFGNLDSLIMDFTVQTKDSAAVIQGFMVDMDQNLKKSNKTTDDAIGLWGSFLDQLNAVSKSAVSATGALNGAANAAGGDGEGGGFLDEIGVGTAYSGGAQGTATNPHAVIDDQTTDYTYGVNSMASATSAAADSMVMDYSRIASSLGNMVGELVNAQGEQDKLGKTWRKFATTVISELGSMAAQAITQGAAVTAASVSQSTAQAAAGTPAAIVESIKSQGAAPALGAAAFGAAIAAMTAMINGIADAGMPAGFLGDGRHTVSIMDNETVLDPDGTASLSRMLNHYERQIARDGIGGGAPGGGGDGMNLRGNVYLDSQQIADVVWQRIESGMRRGAYTVPGQAVT